MGISLLSEQNRTELVNIVIELRCSVGTKVINQLMWEEPEMTKDVNRP